MNMFARFDEDPAMIFKILRKQNVTDGWMDAYNVKAVYPPQTKIAGGLNISQLWHTQEYA